MCKGGLEMKMICPECGQVYTDPPAVSKIDNQTYVCANCGRKETVEYYRQEITKNNPQGNETREKVPSEEEGVIKYKVWSKEKDAVLWTFECFREETNSNLVDFDQTRPLVAREMIITYQTREPIKEEIFKKYGLAYQIVE